MGHPYGPALMSPGHLTSRLPARLADPAVAPPRRSVRASVSAAAAAALGLTGHLAAGGEPTVAGAGLAFLAVLLPSWLLAGRERGWTVIAGVQVSAQQVLHPILVAASGAPAPTALPHDLMFHLHVLGAVAMAVWLRLGERRLWAAARRLAAHLARWSRLLLGAPQPRAASMPVPRPRTAIPLRFAAPLRHVLTRRGPPLPA